MYIIYYIKNNYMFRHFSLAIFILINEKKNVSSYTRLLCVVYNGEVRDDVRTHLKAMKSAETCSCSLCNKLYTYLYHHIVVLEKYIHSSLVGYKHNGDDEPYD